MSDIDSNKGITLEVSIEHRARGTKHTLVVTNNSTWRESYHLDNETLDMIRQHIGDHLLDPLIAPRQGVETLVSDIRAHLDGLGILPIFYVTSHPMARDYGIDGKETFPTDIEEVPASFLIALRNAVQTAATKASRVEPQARR